MTYTKLRTMIEKYLTPKVVTAYYPDFGAAAVFTLKCPICGVKTQSFKKKELKLDHKEDCYWKEEEK